MSPLKIVHFITSIDRKSGGTTTYMQLLTERISKEVEVIIATGITPDPVKITGAKVRYFDLSLKKLMLFRREAGKFLDEWKPDVVHINGIWELPNTIIQHCAQKRKIPVIISPHGMLEPWILSRNSGKKNLAMALYQRRSITVATCLHATALSEFEQIRKLGFKTDMKIIENGIKTEHIQIKKSWSKTNTILFLSRVDPKKGIENLIDALDILRKSFSEYRVIIAGEGDPAYIGSLKQRAKEKKVIHQFKFCGGIYGPGKWDLYRQADVFVLPTYSENFGIVIPEALACGTPVITTTGAPWNDLLEYQCGWWINTGPTPLAEALLDFAKKSDEELERMGRNGCELIHKKYSVEKMGEKMVDFYHSVLLRN